MKPKQAVGVILGILIILLALIAYMRGGPNFETQSGQMSLLLALVLGVIVAAGSLKEPKTHASQTKFQGESLPPPPDSSMDEELPPPPPGYESVSQPQQTMQPPRAAPKKATQIVAVVVVVIVALAAFVVFFGGPILGLGGPYSGTWRGTGDYYYVDIFGLRDSCIHGNVVMKLTQSGSTVKGTLDISPLTQQDVGDPGYVPAVDEHISVRGTVNNSKLTFYVESSMAVAGPYSEVWVFTLTGNQLVGQVTNLDEYAYLGLDSDVGAFVLSK